MYNYLALDSNFEQQNPKSRSIFPDLITILTVLCCVISGPKNKSIFVNCKVKKMQKNIQIADFCRKIPKKCTLARKN